MKREMNCSYNIKLSYLLSNVFLADCIRQMNADGGQNT
jgi:hypothetical protein